MRVAFSPRREPVIVLTSAAKAGKLGFWFGLAEGVSGTACVGPEADAAEPQEPGSQPEERLPDQDPGEEAPRRHRRRGRRGREEAPSRDRGRDRPGRQEGRDSRQRRRAIQEPAVAQDQRPGRGEGLTSPRRAAPRPQVSATTAASATRASEPFF